uniref:PARP-type domain-containing protein n=1 Tax=Timema genevievae TaxID=629358 RepID=A0A7R9JSW5_TIMGE|nr:unnamed protein product [Timema genevievae]
MIDPGGFFIRPKALLSPVRTEDRLCNMSAQHFFDAVPKDRQQIRRTDVTMLRYGVTKRCYAVPSKLDAAVLRYDVLTMSDDAAGENEEPQVEEKKFFAERAKSGRANCKKCKQKLEAGKLRLAKAGYNPFGPGLMKMWHHVPCLFDVFSRQRKTTPKIESPDDIEGWSDLEEEDQDEILQFLPGCSRGPTTQKKENKEKKDTLAATPTQKKKKKTKKTNDDMENSSVIPSNSSGSLNYKNHKDNSFREFRRLCADLANASSYTAKTAIVQAFFTKGTDGGYNGDKIPSPLMPTFIAQRCQLVAECEKQRDEGTLHSVTIGNTEMTLKNISS